MLDPSAEEIRRWGNAAISEIAEYLETIRNRRVYPSTSSRELRHQLKQSLPVEGLGFGPLLATFRDVLVP